MNQRKNACNSLRYHASSHYTVLSQNLEFIGCTHLLFIVLCVKFEIDFFALGSQFSFLTLRHLRTYGKT